MDEISSSPDKTDKTDNTDKPDGASGADGQAPGTPRRDRANRSAALMATLIAVPVTVAVAGFTFAKLAPDTPAAEPAPAATSAQPQSTAPVEMAAPKLPERPEIVCRALTSQLPSTVRGLGQRPVTAGPEQNAAYGDPALTVACGGDEPTPAPPTTSGWSTRSAGTRSRGRTRPCSPPSTGRPPCGSPSPTRTGRPCSG